MTILVENIDCDKTGFNRLSSIYEKIITSTDSDITLDFSRVSWFDAHMSSPCGAILEKARNSGKKIRIINLHEQVETILAKNGFLLEFGYKQVVDGHASTIPYKKFKLNGKDEFIKHIELDLLAHRGFTETKDKECVLMNIFEIFDNAVVHSESLEGVFCCGQLFPQKKNLDYNITDLGVGFRERIFKSRSITFNSDIEAIKWAMVGLNSSKTDRPGGMGLRRLQDYMIKTKGILRIVSYKGYIKVTSTGISEETLDAEYPGTVIHLGFHAKIS